MKFVNIVTLLLTAGIVFTPAYPLEKDKIVLPDMGDSSGALITPLQEKELGEAFFRNLHSRIKISQDPDIQYYIQSIGQKLATHSDAPATPYHFFVVLDTAINAFAGPGGYIGVNSGLILASGSESELASVLAHEIAHITQRHLYRAFEAANQLSLPTAAATLAAILIGTQSAALGQAALLAVQAGSLQSQINFTRSNEAEADRVGIQTLARAGFDPRSMPVFFERLQQSSRYYGRNIPEFLRTHPVTTSRISDTRGRAEKYPYRQYPDSIDYLLVKAKLRVNSAANDEDIQHYFQTLENQGTDEQRAAAHYGIALIHIKKQQFDKARAIFLQLIKKFPTQVQYLTGLAKIETETQNYDQALQLYQTAMRYHPANFSMQLEYIATLLKAGQAEKARKILQSFSYKKQQSAYYGLLARTYGALNNTAESHRYMAEYYYSIGDIRSAITQIKLAKKVPDVNFYLTAILDQRLQFFIDEERQAKQ